MAEEDDVLGELPDLDGYDAEDAALVEEARRILREKADPMSVAGGVSITWLSIAFRMDRKKVMRALHGVAPLRKTKRGPLYDLRVAAQYLVPPKTDVSEFLRRAAQGDLPVALQNQFWAAQNNRQKFEEAAGDLWRTDAILDLLGEVAKQIKGTITLWADNVDRRVSLTPEQKTALRDQTDHLLTRLYEMFKTMPEKSQTPSSISEIDEIIERTERSRGNDIIRRQARTDGKPNGLDDVSDAEEDYDVL